MFIKKLKAQNFKSLKNFEIDCKKINVFIGEPNTGKSNIAEILRFLSALSPTQNGKLSDYIRIEQILNIFYDELTDNSMSLSFTTESDNFELEAGYNPNKSSIILEAKSSFLENKSKREEFLEIRQDYSIQGGKNLDFLDFIKPYIFKEPQILNNPGPEYLKPPFGTNI
ncbi:MAG: AAA family ATPase [Verrucomicrobiota bacterium]|nr:AAA family ATPase [Verrucomicrobiota bacterium]